MQQTTAVFANTAIKSGKLTTKSASTLIPLMPPTLVVTTASGIQKMITKISAEHLMTMTSKPVNSAAPAMVVPPKTTVLATRTLLGITLITLKMVATGMMPTQFPADFGTPMTSMPRKCAAHAVVDTCKDYASTLMMDTPT